MAKNDRDEVARRELAHALEALGDGIGHETWGPGPVINRLCKRVLKEPAVQLAVEALEAATMATHDLLHRVKREDALGGIRRLAPVFLELIIEKDEERQAKASVKSGLWRALTAYAAQTSLNTYPLYPLDRRAAGTETRHQACLTDAETQSRRERHSSRVKGESSNYRW